MYVTRLQISYSNFFFEHGSKSKLYKKVHAEVLYFAVPIHHFLPLSTQVIIEFLFILCHFIYFAHINKIPHIFISYKKYSLLFHALLFFT